MTDESVIEVKTTDNFEPQFVKKIKAEVKKISSESFGSQVSQVRGYGKDANRKSSNGSKSSISAIPKRQQKLPIITKIGDCKLNRSKSSNTLVEDNRNESQLRRNDILNRHKSDENVNKENKMKRSHSSNGRLSGTASDIHNNNNSNNNDKRKSEKSDLHRSQSQPSVEQRPDNIRNNNNINNSNDSSRDRVIRKIKVNNKYYQILNCIGQGGSSKVSVFRLTTTLRT